MTDIKFEVKVDCHKEEIETKRTAEKWRWGKLRLRLSLVADLSEPLCLIVYAALSWSYCYSRPSTITLPESFCELLGL